MENSEFESQSQKNMIRLCPTRLGYRAAGLYIGYTLSFILKELSGVRNCPPTPDHYWPLNILLAMNSAGCLLIVWIVMAWIEKKIWPFISTGTIKAMVYKEIERSIVLLICAGLTIWPFLPSFNANNLFCVR